MQLLAESDQLLAARWQMAFTLGSHIILACFGMGMPILMLIAELQGLRRADKVWMTLARRWSKSFAVLFAVGAVSGTVLSFELGTLWPEFMGTFGAVIGLPFTMEGFAFFTEAIFAGIYLYTWDRLSPRAHWWSGVPVAISGTASAWFVVTANSWMNVPRGFEMEAGEVVAVQPWEAMLNPATGAQTTHMIVAAYMVTGFGVASFYAWRWLRGNRDVYHLRAFTLAMGMGCVFAPIQIAVGDWSAKVVADSQPIKLAAMEGHFETESGASLAVGGIPIESRRETVGAIKIPKMLSFLAHGDFEAEVLGLNEFGNEHWPPVAIVHVAFQIMVFLGTALVGIAVWFWGALIVRRKSPRSSLFFWAGVASGPMAVIALQAGWVVTEVGRQPWIVQGWMYTKDAVTTAPGIWPIFFVTISIYIVLLVGSVIVLKFIGRKPLPDFARQSVE